ncbi:MAG TPA: hypothetical protein VLA39_04615 [Marinobacterium sp.]|nr:hypothetical protein [Marinobacterium sp.]
MSRYIDKETLMVLLDSNRLSQAQKLDLVRAYTKQERRANTAEGAKIVVRAWRRIIDQVVNHRALQTVFSSPLMRSQH